jgi:hypothetical protein
MRRFAFFVLLLGLLFPFVAAPTEAAITDNPTVAARAATDYLRTLQLPDGSINKDGFGVGDKGFDPIFAFVTLGIDPRAVALPGGASLLEYAERNAAAYAGSAGGAAKALLGAVAANADPRNFGGTDLVAAVTAAYSPTTGLYGSGVFVHSLALLGLQGAGARDLVRPEVITALLEAQQEDGGWEFSAGQGSDTNTTALAIQALAALDFPLTSPIFTNARAFLRTAQNDTGGFAYSPGPENVTDANSTGLVLQAIAALGESPADDWARPDGNPLTALLDQQNPSGAFRSPFTGDADNVFATLQAVPGLVLQPFPMELERVFLPLVING